MDKKLNKKDNMEPKEKEEKINNDDLSEVSGGMNSQPPYSPFNTNNNGRSNYYGIPGQQRGWEGRDSRRHNGAYGGRGIPGSGRNPYRNRPW